MSSRAKLYISAVVLGAWFTVGSLPTFAAVPDSISYQGILKTPGGSPVPDGNYSVTFRIYDVASGPNAAIWTETKSVSTIGGVFTTLLGSVTALPPSIVSGPNRFLGITVAADPEMTPRTAIVAVPYAYRIATVDGAAGGSISGDVSVTSGDINLDASSPTTGNIYKAGERFIHDFGVNNTFIGHNAGNFTTSGWNNTASGRAALASNTTGTSNTANGAYSLASNTTGLDNTASGYYALYYNVNGADNTASGNYALYSNTSGGLNTASGFGALQSNTTGGGNTASGYGALTSNTTANGNTACGSDALYGNTVGHDNTATGSEALASNTSGNYNTASGYGALAGNTIASGNTASGYNALSNNSTGYDNTASGLIALTSNTTGHDNTATGYRALYSNTSGNYNTACGIYALDGNTTGSTNTALGYNADVSVNNLTNATAIGNGAVVNASNKIRLGNAAVSVIEGQVAYTFPSDSTRKENFQPVNGDEVLRKIREFNLRSWNYIGNDPQQFRHYGPMAQEFFAAFGHDGIGTSGTPTTINSGDEAGILMIAIQALEKDNESIKAENQSLQSQIAELREMIRAQAGKQK